MIEELVSMLPVFITYYLVALGHGFFEKSGVLNLAIDGLFVLGATVAFTVAAYSLNPWIGLFASSIVCSLFGAFIAYMATKLPISHGALGLSLMFLGYGLSLVIGIPANNYVYAVALKPSTYTIPTITSTLVVLFIISVSMGVLLYYILEKTKLGAMIRASGEDPYIAEALGVDVLKTRIIAGAIGYALIGLGSAFFTLTWRIGWDPKIYLLGHGWIAFAISLAAGRHPILTILTTSLFAGLIGYQYVVQTTLGISTEITKMLPFIAAVISMTVYYIAPLKRKLASPKSLGKPYYREERTV